MSSLKTIVLYFLCWQLLILLVHSADCILELQHITLSEVLLTRYIIFYKSIHPECMSVHLQLFYNDQSVLCSDHLAATC